MYQVFGGEKKENTQKQSSINESVSIDDYYQKLF